jgi:hypothetical protein
MVMLHTLLIAAHALGGTAAFAAGCLALRPPARGEPPTFRVYLGALWVMVLFLVLAVALDWGTLATVSRLLFGTLTVLAFYVGWRGWRAFQDVQRRGAGWTGPYLDDLGFTLIALFDGFVIIGALDLGSPVWLVVAIGVLGILVGRGAISRMKTLAAA